MAAVTEHPQMREPQMGLTFEKVWAAFMEAREAERISHEKTEEMHRKTEETVNRLGDRMDRVEANLEKSNARLDRHEANLERLDARLDKQAESIDRLGVRLDRQAENIDKLGVKIDKQAESISRLEANVNRVTANVGGLNRSMGELIETLIAARLWEKFDAYPYNLKRAYQRVPLFNEKNRILTDIDILLSNGEYAMAVEIKAQLNKKDDVDHHLKRMDLILQYPPAECKGKILLRAMAGGAVDPDVQNYAQSVGFFVLELTSESVRLAEAPAEFTARQWSYTPSLAAYEGEPYYMLS